MRLYHEVAKRFPIFVMQHACRYYCHCAERGACIYTKSTVCYYYTLVVKHFVSEKPPIPVACREHLMRPYCNFYKHLGKFKVYYFDQVHPFYPCMCSKWHNIFLDLCTHACLCWLQLDCTLTLSCVYIHVSLFN